MITKLGAAFVIGLVVGFGAVHYYPHRAITSAEIIISPQHPGAPITLQLNLNDVPSGWIVLTPSVTDYIRRNLPKDETP